MSETSYQACQTDPTIPYIDEDVNHIRLNSSSSLSTSGKLKIVEIVLSLLVFICSTVAVRNYAVFYGCAVWGSVVGFLCMVVAAILLVAHLSRSSASAPILEILFNGSAALGFFLAGVLLTIVADAAITIPRVHYFRSSLTHDALDINEIEIFGPFTAEDGKVDWLIQTTPANAHEFRAAVCAAVFSFAAALVFGFDAFLVSQERRRRSKPSTLRLE